MKKLLALLLALVMLLALAACGDDAKTNDDDDDEKPSTVTTAPQGDPTDPSNPTDPPIVNPDPSDPTDPPIDTPTDPTDPPKDVPDDPSSENNSLEKQILGTWKTTVLADGSAMGNPNLTGELELNMTYTFTEDGTATCVMDTDSYFQSIKDMIVENIYVAYGGKEAAEEYCQNTLQMSCEEYADAAVDQLVGSLDLTVPPANWHIEGDQLTMDDETVTISIDGDTMTWISKDLADATGIQTIILYRVK